MHILETWQSIIMPLFNQAKYMCNDYYLSLLYQDFS